MKTTRWLIGLLIAGLSITALAATNEVTKLPGATGGDTTVELGKLLIAVIVPAIVAFIKWVVPKMPSAVVPPLAIALGALSDYVGAKLGVWNGSMVLGLVLGAAGIGIREAGDQIKQLKSPAVKNVASIILGTILIGCATVNSPEQLAGYLADARDIAEVGTTAALLEKPALRSDLGKVRDSLKALESLPDDKVTVDALIAALSRLPIDQLQSEKGRIYALGGRILVRRFVSWSVDPEVDVGGSGAVKKFATAIREGMDTALK